MSASKNMNQSALIAEIDALKSRQNALEMDNAALHAEIDALKAQPPSAPAKKTRAKKERAEGEPAPTSVWRLFCDRLRALVHTAEEGLEKKTHFVVINQFASSLWSQKHEWEDEDILAAWPDFVPPEVSKSAMKKSSTASTGSEKKPRAWSDEAKARAKAKREAKKAAPAEPVADAESEAESEAEAPPPPAAKPKAPKSTEAKPPAPTPAAPAEPVADAESEAEAPPPPPAAKPKAPKAPKSTEAKPAAPAPAAPAAKPKAPKKVIDLTLDRWTHEGITYYKNERNDVVSLEMEWVGRWNGKEIDGSAPEPADFDSLSARE